MPLIAYQGAHGANDYPLHIAFFSALKRRGILNSRYTFAIDPTFDPAYSLMLTSLFESTCLSTDVSPIVRARIAIMERFGRGGRPVARLDSRFDAVVEGPGGRIHPLYSGGIDIFWRYPRSNKKAIVFHSIESGVLAQPNTRASIASANLVIARNSQSAAAAREAGCKNVVTSSDIVMAEPIKQASYKPGFAVALRLPNSGADEAYYAQLRSIINYLSGLGPVDQVRVENPFGDEQRASEEADRVRKISLWGDDNMYVPFLQERDAVISCRLHTTLLALQSGNRQLLQFQVEEGTSKLRQILDDIGLTSLAILPCQELSLRTVERFIEMPETLPEAEVISALKNAQMRVEAGLDAFEDWLSHVH